MNFFEDGDLEYYFPERLEEAMDAQGLTPSDFEDCNVASASSLNAYIKGKTIPNLRNATKIASFLGVSLDYLCGYEASRIGGTIKNETNGRKAPWL